MLSPLQSTLPCRSSSLTWWVPRCVNHPLCQKLNFPFIQNERLNLKRGSSPPSPQAIMFFLLSGGVKNDTCARVAGWWGVVTSAMAFYIGLAGM